MATEKYKYSELHLFHINPKEQLRKWIFELEFFVFTRSSGGHDISPDELITAIEYSNEYEFKKLAEIFNLPLERFNPNYERPTDPRFEIFNYKCFVTKGTRYLTIRPCHNWSYVKDDNDFLACKAIEKAIKENQLGNKVALDYLRNLPSAITKDLYGDYFE
jgi:hypothetical protein